MGWFDAETGNPMVTLVYRCETDEREVSLNHEHDDYEWVPPETAAERLGDALGGHAARAVERATTLDGSGPFDAAADPDADATSEAVLGQLAEARAVDVPGN